MIDEFVKNAFDDAIESKKEDEFKAYAGTILKNLDVYLDTIAEQVGLDRMEQLAKIVIKNNAHEILADYTKVCVILGFHIGYGVDKYTNERG